MGDGSDCQGYRLRPQWSLAQIDETAGRCHRAAPAGQSPQAAHFPSSAYAASNALHDLDIASENSSRGAKSRSLSSETSDYEGKTAFEGAQRKSEKASRNSCKWVEFRKTAKYACYRVELALRHASRTYANDVGRCAPCTDVRRRLASRSTVNDSIDAWPGTEWPCYS